MAEGLGEVEAELLRLPRILGAGATPLDTVRILGVEVASRVIPRRGVVAAVGRRLLVPLLLVLVHIVVRRATMARLETEEDVGGCHLVPRNVREGTLILCSVDPEIAVGLVGEEGSLH